MFGVLDRFLVLGWGIGCRLLFCRDRGITLTRRRVLDAVGLGFDADVLSVRGDVTLLRGRLFVLNTLAYDGSLAAL